MKKLLFFFGIGCLTLAAHAQKESLQKQITEVIGRNDAQAGVAVIFDGKDTLTINNNAQYPLMSVVKFHQALAVADYLSRKHISLDHRLTVRKRDLKPDTYSPLRDKYPDGGVQVSYRELLAYTLQLSDNNACDILFSRTMSPRATDRFLRKSGLQRFSITATEDDMHKNLEKCYANWSTPLECTVLLERFLERADNDPYLDFIRQTLMDVKTGQDRLPKPLTGTSATIGHKTGTGDRNSRGEIIGINDIGFVHLPDGTRYSIAVLVRDFKGSMEEAEQIIAEISEAVYRFATREKRKDERKRCSTVCKRVPKSKSTNIQRVPNAV